MRNKPFLGKRGVYSENFIDQTDAAASISGTRGVAVGEESGYVIAKLVAGDKGLALSAGKKVTLTAKESDDIKGTYAAYTPALTVSYTAGDAAVAFEPEEVITEIRFPSTTKAFAKTDFTTDDTAVSGNIKVVGELF